MRQRYDHDPTAAADEPEEEATTSLERLGLQTLARFVQEARSRSVQSEDEADAA